MAMREDRPVNKLSNKLKLYCLLEPKMYYMNIVVKNELEMLCSNLY